MKTIGILGGASNVATAEYYGLINEEVRKRLGGNNTGEMVIANMNWAEVVRIVEGDLWEEGSLYLHDKAKRLESARSDFIICVANTMHRMASDFMKDIKIPLLHIADPTAVAIRRQGFSKLLLLGTKPTMSATFMRDRYRDLFQIEMIVPNEEDQNFINKVIFEELSRRNFRPESKERYLQIVEAYAQEGAQGLILACTEIQLLISQEDMPQLPFFDVLRLHVEAAVEVALDSRSAAESIQDLQSKVHKVH